MMNYIWAGLILIGLCWSCVKGNPDDFTLNLLDSSSEAVSFIISLAGVMALWSGLMNIADKSGLITLIARRVRKIFSFLFPEQHDDKTISLMLMSFVANLFGAGNSATVFSLRTMEELDKQNNHSPYASNTMCMFMTLSMSMLQLVPITVIQIRRNLGSQTAEDIIIPSIIAGIISMLVSVAVCRMIERKKK